MKDEIFKVGEVAFLKNLPAPFCHMNGCECEILGALMPREVIDIFGTEDTILAYEITYRGMVGAVLPIHLKRRVANDTDFGKVADWADCAWNPGELVGA